jgi:hypothetical protein
MSEWSLRETYFFGSRFSASSLAAGFFPFFLSLSQKPKTYTTKQLTSLDLWLRDLLHHGQRVSCPSSCGGVKKWRHAAAQGNILLRVTLLEFVSLTGSRLLGFLLFRDTLFDIFQVAGS